MNPFSSPGAVISMSDAEQEHTEQIATEHKQEHTEHPEHKYKEHHAGDSKDDQTKNYIIVALATALVVIGLIWIRDTTLGNPSPSGPAAAPSAPSLPAPSRPVDM